MYTHLFHESDEELQSYLSLNADVALRRGDATFKLLVDKVAEADKKSVRNVELEIYALSLKDYQHTVSKLVIMLSKIVDTLQANAAFKSDHSNGSTRSFIDDERAENFRVHIFLCQRDLNRN